MGKWDEPPQLTEEQRFKIEFKKVDDLLTGLFYFLQLSYKKKDGIYQRIEEFEEERNRMYLQYSTEPIEDKDSFIEKYQKLLDDSRKIAYQEADFSKKQVSDGNLRFYYLVFLQEYEIENGGKQITEH